ncbi:PhoX family protein [Paenibacillus harenae]|uniref:Secreted PhoX family phosphatase n=1 Tax=Paenibacillus harenae TaxID=306543 RepID=A0ABT9U2Y2_PAEHA|nr:alkaline phosphatase PhoX [Paenibacillus harenae]MDQ0112814.1 secreted PhoX family phosphatase [Paenibacillus harenae]
MNKTIDRKTFLSYLGTGAAALAAASAGLGTLNGKASAMSSTADHLFGFNTNRVSGYFEPIAPSSEDKLLLPKNFKYDVVAAFDDVINAAGERFGEGSDYNAYFPLEGSNVRGLLVTNHEYSTIFSLGPVKDGKMTKEQLHNNLYYQGMSVIEVYRDEKGVWKMDINSSHARRINGYTKFDLTGPAKGGSALGGATTAVGTFANCSGGVTLWNTVLSCEENFAETAAASSLPETHYGWVIEIDPFDKKYLKKHTALGRFNHENTAMGIAKDGRVVVYMGDDKKDACVYKFISKGQYNKSLGRGNSALLEEGTLYVANLKKGEWVPVTLEAVSKAIKDKPELQKKFVTQGDVVTYCQEAALLVGGTPTDRPEDIEISPFDNTIFICHTNNDNHGNIHGHITRIFEGGSDLGSLTFDFEIFAAGGRQSGFSSPDNLAFDSNGHLWVVTDISSSSQNKGVHKSFMNNGLFVIPTSGPDQAKALQFASAPVESELTGPFFTPDEQTLFLSIQHPGENTTDLNKPTSRWPHRAGDSKARSGVVAISGFKLG